jgi:transcriptional regulator with XRE-family HTH domain
MSCSKKAQYQFRNAMNYGKAIRITRALADISQQELARALGTDPSYISLLEANKREPSRELLEKLAVAFKVPLHLLVLMATEESDTGSGKEKRLSEIAETLANLLFTEDDHEHGRTRNHAVAIRQSKKARAKVGKQPNAAKRNSRKSVLSL